jgi:hypothetical protein
MIGRGVRGDPLVGLWKTLGTDLQGSCWLGIPRRRGELSAVPVGANRS